MVRQLWGPGFQSRRHQIIFFSALIHFVWKFHYATCKQRPRPANVQKNEENLWRVIQHRCLWKWIHPYSSTTAVSIQGDRICYIINRSLIGLSWPQGKNFFSCPILLSSVLLCGGLTLSGSSISFLAWYTHCSYSSIGLVLFLMMYWLQCWL